MASILHVDDYGYPLPPDSRRKLRALGIRTSKSILRTGISLLMSVIGGFLKLGRKGRRPAPLTPPAFQPRRILVIRLDLIGDLVLSLTAVRALKRTYPEAEIDLLAMPSSARIIAPEQDPDIAQLLTYDPNVWRRPRALVQLKNWREAIRVYRLLRRRRYDLALSVFGDWAAIIAVLSGAQRRVGFGRESYPGFMTDSVPGYHWAPGDHKHEVDYCLELARAAGATTGPEVRIPHLYVDPRAHQAVEQLLSQEGVRDDRPLIACHVSSNNGQSKRWPTPYWATLIDRMAREAQAYVVLTGAPDDLPLIADITRRLTGPAINLAGKTSLGQLAALLQRADLLISGDSGPMHIAAAVGTPLIAIHGPTDLAQSGPVSPDATVLRSDIWCSPCYNAKAPADCRFYTTQCMKNVTPGQVFEVVQEKLRERLRVSAGQEVRE
ncbi:MAG: lipopolysaccharide heptosyltransferase II [Ktedonobacteraceae bacterium]|nr:lipopolysaccharide heptosyltransferase II [Ktedonobacteraceae bacterium]